MGSTRGPTNHDSGAIASMRSYSAGKAVRAARSGRITRCSSASCVRRSGCRRPIRRRRPPKRMTTFSSTPCGKYPAGARRHRGASTFTSGIPLSSKRSSRARKAATRKSRVKKNCSVRNPRFPYYGAVVWVVHGWGAHSWLARGSLACRCGATSGHLPLGRLKPIAGQALSLHKAISRLNFGIVPHTNCA